MRPDIAIALLQRGENTPRRIPFRIRLHFSTAA
jgi:hypothetical protein